MQVIVKSEVLSDENKKMVKNDSGEASSERWGGPTDEATDFSKELWRSRCLKLNSANIQTFTATVT